MNKKELVDYILNNHKIRKVNNASIDLDTAVYKSTTFHHFLNNKLLVKLQSNILELDDDQKKMEIKSIFKDILAHVSKPVQRSSGSGVIAEYFDGREENSFVPLIDAKTGEFIMFDETTNTIADNYCYQAWSAEFPGLKKEFPPALATLDYDPLSMETSKNVVASLSSSGGAKRQAIWVNTHIKPYWRKRNDVAAELPEIISDFMEHLFPNANAIEFVYQYLHNMVTLRNGNNTALILAGAKGTGKTTFTNLMKALVGHSNATKVHRAFFKSNFNAIIARKQVLIGEEIALDTPEKIDKIKDYCNNSQTIEKKGYDARANEETFFQMVFCVNRNTDVKVDQDERRMSIPELTATNLRDVWEEEYIHELTQLINNEKSDELAAFGNWLIEYEPSEKWDAETPYKGERFDELVVSSLWEWQKFIRDVILSKAFNEYKLLDLQTRYQREGTSKSSKISREAVKMFLNEYKQDGGKLGKVKRNDEKEWVIIPDDRYMPDEDERDYEDIL